MPFFLFLFLFFCFGKTGSKANKKVWLQLMDCIDDRRPVSVLSNLDPRLSLCQHEHGRQEVGPSKCPAEGKRLADILRGIQGAI